MVQTYAMSPPSMTSEYLVHIQFASNQEKHKRRIPSRRPLEGRAWRAVYACNCSSQYVATARAHSPLLDGITDSARKIKGENRKIHQGD